MASLVWSFEERRSRPDQPMKVMKKFFWFSEIQRNPQSQQIKKKRAISKRRNLKFPESQEDILVSQSSPSIL
jgi:hypothetical protein